MVFEPKQLTLCILEKDDMLLLGRKKRGFGVGKINGFGGKLEPGESIEQALVREVYEESGMKLLSYEKRGIISFEIEYAGSSHLEVHIFHSSSFEGGLTENDEMDLLWIPKNDIPYDEMWADDRFWMPVLLSGKYFLGTGIFDVDQKLLSFTFERVEEVNLFLNEAM